MALSYLPTSSAALTQSSLTQLLDQWQQGDGLAFEKVMQETFRDLQRMAKGRMYGNEDLTLSPADLLNEAVIRVMESQPDYKNRAHFFATMSLHMRTVLVDHARARSADKRGAGAVHVTLSHATNAEESMATELIALDQALTALEKIDARGSQVLHLTYFAGLSREEIAEVVGISVPTVDRELRFTRAWLAETLGHDLI